MAIKRKRGTVPKKFNIRKRVNELGLEIKNFKNELEKRFGFNPNTLMGWMQVEKGDKKEIPYSAMLLLKDFFNEKYHEKRVNSLISDKRFNPIEDVSEFYNEGELIYS